MENNNKNHELYDYATKADREKFVSEFERIKNKTCSCYCNKCYKHLGNFELNMTYFAKLTSTTIPTEVLENIIPSVPVVCYFNAHCKKCNTITTHFITDYALGKVIQKLNKAEIQTSFSCEGHQYNSSGFESPYIAFPHDVREYFDMENPLLKYWYIEDNTDKDWPSNAMCLRVSEDASMRYILDNEFIKDLSKYIDKFILKGKKK